MKAVLTQLPKKRTAETVDPHRRDSHHLVETEPGNFDLPTLPDVQRTYSG
jgi:hypothetical protein